MQASLESCTISAGPSDHVELDSEPSLIAQPVRLLPENESRDFKVREVAA